MSAPSGLEVLLGRLDAVSQRGPRQWVARCPCHADVNPSLVIDLKVQVPEGRLVPLLYCYSCGPCFRDVLRAVALSGTDLYRGLDRHAEPSLTVSDPVQRAHSGKRWLRPSALPDCELDRVRLHHRSLMQGGEQLRYVTGQRGVSIETVLTHQIGCTPDGSITIPVCLDGALVNVRTYTPKRRPKMRGLRGVPMLVYPDAAEMMVYDHLLLLEGEWDTLLARTLELPAFTHTGGASAQLPEPWRDWFAGRGVTICFDSDDAGRRGAARTAERLRDWGAKVRVIDLGLERGEDFSDYILQYGHSRADFCRLVARTSWWGARAARP